MFAVGGFGRLEHDGRIDTQITDAVGEAKKRFDHIDLGLARVVLAAELIGPVVEVGEGDRLERTVLAWMKPLAEQSRLVFILAAGVGTLVLIEPKGDEAVIISAAGNNAVVTRIVEGTFMRGSMVNGLVTHFGHRLNLFVGQRNAAPFLVKSDLAMKKT